MKILNDLNAIPPLKNPVVTMGSFDGVHLGHRQLFAQVRKEAKRIDGVSVAITFNPHPQAVLHPNTDFFQIYSLEENAQLIENEGIDFLLVIPFTKEFSQISSEDFFKDVIVEKLGAKVMVMGPNHSFGHNRSGRRETIDVLCKANNVTLVEVPELVVQGVKVHSAHIRKLIANNNWDIAADLLGK